MIIKGVSLREEKYFNLILSDINEFIEVIIIRVISLIYYIIRIF